MENPTLDHPIYKKQPKIKKQYYFFGKLVWNEFMLIYSCHELYDMETIIDIEYDISELYYFSNYDIYTDYFDDRFESFSKNKMNFIIE